jgi:glucosamine--fructose-6-phosphate aminotransferase (isomerizing)
MNQPPAGALMSDEIAEQPAILAGLDAGRATIAEVGERIARHRPRFALLAARGSSDHAALYAKYLIEVLLQLPCGLVSPSTTTLYGARPDLTDVVLIGVSQSGGSPDLVEVTETARSSGALTVAVTNTPDSPLGTAAELGVDIQAGPERAVAATKTYSATLFALYLLIDAWRGGDGSAAANIGELAQSTVDGSRTPVADAVARYRFVERVLACGRGYSSATASEAALKIAETSYLGARAYSGADLLHGPVAAVDAETAVLAVTSEGHGGEAMRPVLDVIKQAGADLLTIGSLNPGAGHHLPVTPSAEEIAPILEILPAQQLALGLALARGMDPDRPRGLSKVTKTR